MYQAVYGDVQLDGPERTLWAVVPIFICFVNFYYNIICMHFTATVLGTIVTTMRQP